MNRPKSTNARPQMGNTRPPNVTDAAGPGVKPDAELRIVGCNVDTIYLSTTAIVSHEMALLHGQLKSFAKSDSRAGPLPTIELAGHLFSVQPGGSKGAPFLLDGGELVLKLNPYAVGKFPTAMIEIHALPLWKLGADVAIANAEAVLAAAIWSRGAGTPPPLHAQISRVDLAVDFQGVVPSREDFSRFVTRASREDEHHASRQFTGRSFGRGAIHARLYDKSAEIVVSGKDWFREVWRDSGVYVDGLPVWRLEYQLRRAALRTLRRRGDSGHVDSWAELLPNIQALWKHLSTQWLSMRLPRTKSSRKRLLPWWSELSSRGFAGPRWAGSDADLFRIADETSLARTTAQLAAFLAREMADVQRGYDRPLSLDALAHEAVMRAARYTERKGRPLSVRVHEIVEKLNARAESLRRLREESRSPIESAPSENSQSASSVEPLDDEDAGK